MCAYSFSSHKQDLNHKISAKINLYIAFFRQKLIGVAWLFSFICLMASSFEME
jgi:hypothetical protein